MGHFVDIMYYTFNIYNFVEKTNDETMRLKTKQNKTKKTQIL